MQTLIDNLPEIEKSEIENLKQLLCKDNPTKQDLVSLKELITKYPDIEIQNDPVNEFSLTPMGYLIFHNKLDMLIESFPTKLEASQKLSELKAIVFSDLYHTAIGFAIRRDNLSIFSKLAGDKKLSDILTTVYEKGSLKGHSLMAIGTAIRFNNLNDGLLELFSKKLKYGEKLSEVTAFVASDKKYKTALKYSIDSAKVDSVRLLIKRDPSSVDLKFERLYLSEFSAARFHESALEHTKILYKQVTEEIKKKIKEGKTGDELIPMKDKYMSIIKILLENGARFEEDQSQYGLPIKITNEIKKIIKTKEFYDGSKDLIKKISESSTLGEIDEKINTEHLKFLFKQSGIPEHLTLDVMNYQSEISKIIKAIATPEEEFLRDLDLTLGILNNAIDPDNFPVIIGYNLLTKRDPGLGCDLTASLEADGKISDEQKTINSYELNKHLMTDSFLEENNEDEIATMFISAGKKAKEMFLENSKKCILPKAKHQKIKIIEQKLLSVDPAVDMALSLSNAKIVALEKQNTEQQEKITELERKDAETQQELAQTKKRLENFEERLARLEPIISQQKKEGPLQEQAPTRKISDYFQKITPNTTSNARGDEIAKEGTKNEITKESSEALVGKKRSRDDQPSSTAHLQVKATKAFEADTPRRSPS